MVQLACARSGYNDSYFVGPDARIRSDPIRVVLLISPGNLVA
jgi:hypothetical protein